jgi:formylglycine-generating enzyme required for sulfatase activity
MQADVVRVGGGTVPLHPSVSISLEPFRIDRHEVTVKRYAACVRAGSCPPPWEANCRYRDGTAPTETDWRVLRRESHPVVCVPFAAAALYCAWAGGALPNEAQWVQAAGGSDGRAYPWGNGWDPLRLNWGDPQGSIDGHRLTAPVGSYPTGASPWGALDMVGNVWEWAVRLPSLDDPSVRHLAVIRGGGFAAAPQA